MNSKLSMIAIIGILLFTGCATTPHIPAMNPVKLNANAVSHLKKEEIQSFLSKTMNQKVAEAGGSKYLVDPKHLAISTKHDWQSPGDGKYVIWEKRAYSYAYGYYYDNMKNEIIEVPIQTCISSYLSGTTGKIKVTEWDCNEFKIYDPGEDYKNTIYMFRTYLSSTFPSLLSEYNSKKEK